MEYLWSVKVSAEEGFINSSPFRSTETTAVLLFIEAKYNVTVHNKSVDCIPVLLKSWHQNQPASLTSFIYFIIFLLGFYSRRKQCMELVFYS